MNRGRATGKCVGYMNDVMSGSKRLSLDPLKLMRRIRQYATAIPHKITKFGPASDEERLLKAAAAQINLLIALPDSALWALSRMSPLSFAGVAALTKTLTGQKYVIPPGIGNCALIAYDAGSAWAREDISKIWSQDFQTILESPGMGIQKLVEAMVLVAVIDESGRLTRTVTTFSPPVCGPDAHFSTSDVHVFIGEARDAFANDPGFQPKRPRGRHVQQATKMSPTAEEQAMP